MEECALHAAGFDERGRLDDVRRMSGKRITGTALSISLLACGCGASAEVVAFNVSPQLACNAAPVTVSWEVRGKAALKADPAPSGWNEQVASKDQRQVNVASDTTFMIVALDANPAKGNSHASQTVQVAPNQNQAAQATCDASLKCSGSLQINAGGAVQVRSVAQPSMKSGMQVKDHAVCVTPPNGVRVCVDPKGSATLNAPANGTWAFDTTLAADENATPPPQLRLVFDFGC